MVLSVRNSCKNDTIPHRNTTDWVRNVASRAFQILKFNRPVVASQISLSWDRDID